MHLTGRVALPDFHNKIPSCIAHTEVIGARYPQSKLPVLCPCCPGNQLVLFDCISQGCGWGEGGICSGMELGVYRCGSVLQPR